MSDIIIQKQNYTIVPEGTYNGSIDSMVKISGRFGDQIQFKIRIKTDGVEGLDGKEVSLTAWASAKYGEKTKLYRWNRAALGPDFNPNADFSAIAMKEKRVLVVVETHISPDGGEYNRVTDILATPQGKKTTPMVPSPEPPDPPDNEIPW